LGLALSDVIGTPIGGRVGPKYLPGGYWLPANARQSGHRGSLRRPAVCPEIDCVRAILPRAIVAAAEHRAQAIGVGADRVLICADAITEEAYLIALASSLGTAYQRLDRVSRADCPLDDSQLIQAAVTGLLPLWESGRIVWVIAPHRQTARWLFDPTKAKPRSFRLTSSDQLWRFVARYGQAALGRQAADGLRHAEPLFSNAPRPHVSKGAAASALAILALTILALVPAVTVDAFGTLLCATFLAAAALRLSSAFYTLPPVNRSFRIDDRDLPIYTIICALHREERVVAKLVAAIRALDYPIEKLDVKFVIEPDDQATRRALDRLDLGPPFEIIVAPAVGPRTKPKALNVALPLARGPYIAVYDAEDTPEPDQLRRAVAEFWASDDTLACLQASLTIDNTADGWLTRMFTANYAGQFDVLLPGLTTLRLPFPLGGSSNHFRAWVLRIVGGWDPYNVTEDADLGIRLHRLGYRAAALPSSTYEEAPAQFIRWLKQRTRWYKGWMQTWLVHMRRPIRLTRELSPLGAIAFQLFLACNVLAALIHPFFMGALCYYLFAEAPLQAVAAMGQVALVFFGTLLIGYASTVALDLVGLQRRGLLAHARVLMLTPFYWFLLSLAAWRGLLQLAYAPYHWEKTEHGLGRHSRLAASQRRKQSGNGNAAGPAAIMARTPGLLALPPRRNRIFPERTH
jgi:glycosyltransferase XagB